MVSGYIAQLSLAVTSAGMATKKDGRCPSPRILQLTRTPIKFVNKNTVIMTEAWPDAARHSMRLKKRSSGRLRLVLYWVLGIGRTEVVASLLQA